MLLDVREDAESAQGHAIEAAHLGKGILERDLKRRYPDPNTELIMYCGGGYRSALTADAAQRMGYRNVYSLIGGYRGMIEAGWPMAKQEGVGMLDTGCQIPDSRCRISHFVLISVFGLRTFPFHLSLRPSLVGSGVSQRRAR